MNDKFTVEICSDLDYEEMVADIYYENHTVALISQEKGPDNMEIKLFYKKNGTSWDFSLSDFVKVILFAEKKLKEMQKKTED